MKHRKLLAVLMMALCLIGTMPFSISAYKTLFVYGETYQYNDVKYIDSQYIGVNDELNSIEVSGVILPIDIILIDPEGNDIGHIDIISGNLDSIVGGRIEDSSSDDGVNLIHHLDLLEIYITGDILIYSPTLGYNIPKYLDDSSFWFSLVHQEIKIDIDGVIQEQSNDIHTLTFYDGTFYVDTSIIKPNIKIAIDNIIYDSPDNETAIIEIMSAFTPVNSIQTQLAYTFEGFSTMAANAFSFIQNYVYINNPIILISLIILALALCLVILKFIFIRR